MSSKMQKSTKRKDSESSENFDAQKSKKPKLVSSNSDKKHHNQKPGEQHGKPKFGKPKPLGDNEKFVPLSARERRIQAKEESEARKKKRKPHYTLEQELTSLWEKMRRRDISKEDRSKLILVALQKMKGKIPEIVSSAASSRVIQTCIKYCSKKYSSEAEKAEKDAVFEELRPHFLNLASTKYACYMLKKMLDRASKEQRAVCISSLRGHVARLLRHKSGSSVVEHLYRLGTAAQKQELIGELFSTELQLFKGLISTTQKGVVDIIAKLGLQKAAVIRHMTRIIQPILEKGFVDHSITHKLLIEYLTIADKESATLVIQQLTGSLLRRMVHTRDGSRLAMLCIKHGSAKDRKKIIKNMKDDVRNMASDQFGSMVLACIFTIVDDTKLVTKIIVRELMDKETTTLKDLVMDKNGRRPLLQLLHPNCSRYLSHDDLASLDLSVPSLCSMDKSETPVQTNDLDGEESGEEAKDEQEDTVTEKADQAKDEQEDMVTEKTDQAKDEQEDMVTEKTDQAKDEQEDMVTEKTDQAKDEQEDMVTEKTDQAKDEEEDMVTEKTDLEENITVAGSKKDPLLRRQELLVKSGLAEMLIDVCVENAEEFIKSNVGKEVMYEVAVGGSDGILCPSLSEKLRELYEAIACVAAKPKHKEAEKKSEHVLEDFHSSRTIRRLVLDCPAFASILYKEALSGKCRSWAQGHCSKILSAFLETQDLQVREMAKEELQVLVDEGALKITETKKPE